MSYTSKYTGEEIDELLSSISCGRGYIEKIFNGRTENLNTNYTLNGNITDYDMLVVQASIPKNGGLITALPIINPQINKSYAMGNHHGNDNDAAYFLTFAFASETTIQQLDRLGKGDEYWQNVSIDAIYGIKLSSITSGITNSNPIGSILPIMGTEAPQDYLICDGRELNISEYKELANYFEKQFGSKNHFGGNGTATFAVPDLRNEFLRGYGELSGEIGEHQDATEHMRIITSLTNNSTGLLSVRSESNTWTKNERNIDSSVELKGGYAANATMSKSVTPNTNEDVDFDGILSHRYTSRPTNVAVLFCIKYTESANNGGNKPVNTNLLLSMATSKGTFELIDSVYNYDEIQVEMCISSITNPSYPMHKEVSRILTSQITENQDNEFALTSFIGGSSYYDITFGFNNTGTNLLIGNVVKGTSWETRTAGISKVIGIKY